MSCRLTIATCLALSLTSPPLWAQDIGEQPHGSIRDTPSVTSGWLIVPRSPRDIEDLLNDHGLAEYSALNRPFGCLHVYADKVTSNAHKLDFMLDALRKDDRVVLAQANHEVERRGWPNDPAVTAQWHHQHPNGKDLDSEGVWPITKGGTNPLGFQPVIAIIEGFDPDHPDLTENTLLNTAEIPNNQVDDDGNGYVDDYLGWNPWTGNDVISQGDHGTAVAGMAGAISGNAFQGAGVAPEAKLLRIDVGPLTEADVVAAYAYAHDLRSQFNATQGQDGTFIVATNASWGIDYADPGDHPIWCAVYDSLLEVGILNCAATANLSINVDLVGDMPTACSSEGLISVTAVDSTGMKSQAGYGEESIDFGAPGKHLLLPTGWDTPEDSSMVIWNGTSFASPAAAGVIALMYGAPCPEFAGQCLAQPALAALRVREALLTGTVPEPQLEGITATGGRLNSMAAVLALMNTCSNIDTVGCTTPEACNFNWFAVEDDGTCDTTTCHGCTDVEACNYAPLAVHNDGSCTHPDTGVDCTGACLWEVDYDTELDAGAASLIQLSGTGGGDHLQVSLNFASGGGAWASDQVLIIVAPDGSARQLGGFSPLTSALLPESVDPEVLDWSGTVPFSWATNAPGQFSASYSLADLGGAGIWTCHFINVFGGAGTSAMQWNIQWPNWCHHHLTDCPGDLDGDDAIGVMDLLWLLSNWGCESHCIGDMDLNGQVGVADLVLLLGTFGEGC